MKNKSLLIARNRSRTFSGGNVTFGHGRTNGERIRDQRLYGVDPNIVSTSYSYDNDDVPEFTVDPYCDYTQEPRRNIVRSGHKEPGPEPQPDSQPEPQPVE